MNNTTIISAKNFEEEVFKIINSSLGNNEPIEFNYKLNSSGRFIADIYLENGCESLNLGTSTLIEIKYLLRRDTYARIACTYKDAIEKEKDSKLIIICKESGLLDSDSSKSKSVSKKIEIWTFDDLRRRLKGEQEQPTKTNDDAKSSSNSVIEKAKSDVSTNKVSLFLGAGVSMDANLPSWDQLLKALLNQKDGKPFLHINEANSEAISNSLANSSIVEGRYIMDGYHSAIREKYKDTKSDETTELAIEEEAQKEVMERIREVLYQNVNKTSKSKLMGTITSIASDECVKQLITYNYDDLIETELPDKSKFTSVYNEDIDFFNNSKTIYHVHGFIPRDESLPGIPVLSEREYHKLYSRMHHWANVVQLNALYTTTCFFIGFSMTDPNQRKLLDLARNVDLGSINAGKAQHYIFLKRQKLQGEAVKAVNDEHCREIENMMFELGLNVIWFDKFEELPQILLSIFRKEKGSTLKSANS